MLLISAVTYFHFSQIISQDTSDKVLQSLHSSAKNTDFFLRTIHETSMNLLHNSTIQKYLNPEEQQNLSDKVELADVVKTISRSRSIISEYTGEMLLYIDNRKVYLSDGAEDFELFFNKFHSFEQYSTEFWKDKLTYGPSFEILSPTKVQSRNDMVPFVTRGIVNGHFAIVVVTIPIKILQQNFTSNAMFASTNFIIFNENNQVILSNGDIAIETETVKELGLFTEKESKGVLRLPVHAVSTVAAFVRSGNYGWKYLALTPESDFNKSARAVFGLIMSISAIMLGIGLLVSFIFTIKIYNPIKKIRDILHDLSDETPEMDRVIGHEFEYIGTGIRQLNELNTLFKSRFQKMSVEYLDHSLLNLLKGSHLEQEETILRLLQTEANFNKKAYLCCNIMFQFNKRFYQDIQDVDRIVILSKLKNVIAGLMREYVLTHVIDFQEYLYVCVVNVEEHDKKQKLLKALNHIIETFHYDFNYCRIYIGIGNMYPGLTRLSQSFSDGMTAIETMAKEEQFQIIDAAELTIDNNIYYSHLDENQIINFLKAGDMEQLKKKVVELLRFNREKGISHNYLKLLYASLYNTGLKYAVDKGLDIPLLYHGDEQTLLSEPSHWPFGDDEKQKLLLSFYSNICNQLRDEKTPDMNKTDSLVSLIVQYVEKNYNEDLYLESIAEKLGVSSKYLSRIFKEKRGSNLVDYISYIRVFKAKELLSSTDLSIGEIGEMVGIYNRTTFLRTFKRFEGVSPFDYRKVNKLT
jgi:AraC-like DNA-binding protein